MIKQLECFFIKLKNIATFPQTGAVKSLKIHPVFIQL